MLMALQSILISLYKSFSKLSNQWCTLVKTLEGFGVSKVIDSDNPSFKPGDLISGFTGWEEYSLIRKTEQLRKIHQDDVPLSFHVGLLGMLSIWCNKIDMHNLFDCFSFSSTHRLRM